MPTHLRAVSLRALLLAALLIPTAAFANTTGDLKHLQNFHLSAQKSLGDFYMYNSMEGDQRYARMIDASRQQAREQLGRLANLADVGAARLQTQLQQQWQRYDGELTTLMAALQQQGYTDLQPVADLAARNRQVLATAQALYEALRRMDGNAISAQVAATRELSVLMQSITVNYAARSASVGASFSGDSSERPIEELVADFSARLSALRKQPGNTTAVNTTLDGVVTKWRYIEGSLRNYNEKSVPFLVNKYSDSIIHSLADVDTLYAQAGGAS
ncbi:hypothetical protein J3Q00_15165 [Pseudomonas sp. D2-3]